MDEAIVNGEITQSYKCEEFMRIKDTFPSSIREIDSKINTIIITAADPCTPPPPSVTL